MRSLLFGLPFLLFVIFTGFAFFGTMRENPDVLPSSAIGKNAPKVSLQPLANSVPFNYDDLANGAVTFVNFWASWCPPCRAEHSKLLEIADSGTVIVGVNIKDDKKNAVSYLQNYNNPFRAISYDPNGRTAIDWGVTAPPETFIIDKDGKVLFRFAGPLVGQDYLNRFLPAYESALTKK